MGRVKWTRAVHHLDALARTCAEMATRPRTIFPLRVTELWAAGPVLDGPADIEFVTVALVVDLPAEDVPWLGEPVGAQHWASAVRLTKNPVAARWRSARAPVWNHQLDRPVLLWDHVGGVAEETLDALRAERIEPLRLPAPTPDELRERLTDELAVSLRALRKANRGYDDQRWRPGKLEPVADLLWRASEGYLDLLDALDAG
jgi:hypothetical protein